MTALVLAGGFDQIALIQELKKRGYRCIVVDYYEAPMAKEYADLHIPASTLDVEVVKELAIQHCVDLITTACTDQALLTVAKVSQELGLPCYLDYQTGLNVTNKSYMKKRFEEFGIPSARHRIVETTENLAVEVDSLKWPLVVKPVDCNSSKGVVKVSTPDELNRTVSQAIQLSRSKRAVIEEYISGQEYTVDFWIDRKTPKLLMVSEITKFPDTFTINGCRTLPDLPEIKIEKLTAIAQKISEAFHLDNMPMFMQVMDNGTDIFVLEFSARMGGGTKYRMIEIYSGIPIMRMYVDRVCGELPSIKNELTKKKILLSFLYCTPGVYSCIDGLENTIKQGIVDEWYPYKRPGSRFEKAETSGDRIGGILISGTTEKQIQQKLTKAYSAIRILSTDGNDMLLR